MSITLILLLMVPVIWTIGYFIMNWPTKKQRKMWRKVEEKRSRAYWNKKVPELENQWANAPHHMFKKRWANNK